VTLEPLRVGLIGCGNVAVGSHLPAYLELAPAARLAAVADPTPDRRELGRTAAGLPVADAHADALELIARPDIDMVDLCTPQHLRRDLAVAAAEAGKHILSEKPLATTPADAQAVVDAARANGVRLGIVHNYLFFAEVRRTLELIAAGEVGQVEVAILDWLSCSDNPGAAAYRPRWRHDPTQAGGGVLMDMLHIVYLAEAFLGRPIERVSAWVDARSQDAPVEDLAIARFETDRNVALVNVGWGHGPGGYAVSGPAGRIEVTYRDGGSGAFEPFERLEVHGASGHFTETSLPAAESIRSLIGDFVAAVRDGRDPVAPGEQGRHILDATLAVYASAATGRTVELPFAAGHPMYDLGVGGLRSLDLDPSSRIVRQRIFGVR
jgi:predicted dehydrogenase